MSILDAFIEGWNRINKFDEKKNYSGITYNEIEERIKELKPNIIGVSCTTPQISSAEKIFSMIKRIDKNIITILGGPHASVRPKECIANSDIDFLVIGEGEYTLLELIQKLENGEKDFDDIKGIAYKKDKEIIITDRRSLIENLDELPFPARHLVPMEKYFEANYFNNVFKKRWTSILTSRGCPYGCNFCTIRLSMGRLWRRRSPENVVNEMELIKKNYKVDEIFFVDDNMTLIKERVEKICDILIGEKMKIKWCTPNGIRADTLDEKIMKKMKMAGCVSISVAPESGNQYVVRKIIGKNLDLNSVENAIRLARKVGIDTFAFFVIGLVGETRENLNDTINFARKLLSLGVHSCHFNIALPYYGTELYAKAKEMGYLTLQDGEEFEFALLNGDAIIKTPEFTPEEIVKIRKDAIKMQERTKLADPRRFFYYFSGFFRAFFTNPSFLFRFLQFKIKKTI